MLGLVDQLVGHTWLWWRWQGLAASHGALFAGITTTRAYYAILTRLVRDLSGLESLVAHIILSSCRPLVGVQ